MKFSLPFLTSTAALVFAGTLAGPVSALDVEDISVDIKPVAVSGTEAQPYFTKLSDDLVQMIADLVTAGEGEGTVDIMVSIRKIGLDGTPIGPDAQEFNELDGVVSIHPAEGGNAVISYPVRLAAYADDRAMPEGFVRIAPSNDDYYMSLLSAFAQEAVAGLQTVPVSAIQGEGETDK